MEIAHSGIDVFSNVLFLFTLAYYNGVPVQYVSVINTFK